MLNSQQVGVHSKLSIVYLHSLELKQVLFMFDEIYRFMSDMADRINSYKYNECLVDRCVVTACVGGERFVSRVSNVIKYCKCYL